MGFQGLKDVSAVKKISWRGNILTRSGAFEFLRSQTRITGLVSSGVAVISFVAYGDFSQHATDLQSLILTFSGSHATALTAFLPKLSSVKLSFFALTSHTVTNPPLPPVTRMCGIFLFQSTDSKLSALDAGVPRRKGLETLFRSEINN